MPHASRAVLLCRVTTDDGCLLDGTLSMPASTPESGRIGFLFVHGTGSNFYAPGVLADFAQQAVDAGFACLRVNTRGHDGLSMIPGTTQSRKGGATHERIADCVYDIAAWVSFFVEQGIEKVVLIGHSMGAVKAIYSQAHEPHSRVTGIMALSPPRFAHQHWVSHPRATAFRSHWQQASEWVAAGEPDRLLECTQPTPFLATAAGFVEKYGPDDRYDYVPLLERLSVPVLIVVGSQTLTASPAFDGLPDWINAAQTSEKAVALRIVPGASMNYAEAPTVPFQLAREWLSVSDRVRAEPD